MLRLNFPFGSAPGSGLAPGGRGAFVKGARMATEAPPSPGRPVPSGGWAGQLDRYFEVTRRGSSIRTEIIAGFATWLTMSYILFVNPAILGTVKDHNGTGLPFDQ